MEKAREFQKNIYFCFIVYTKAFDCVDHNKLWQVLKEMGVPDHLIYLLRNLYVGQKAYLTDMQNKSCKRLEWMNPKLELRLLEEISTTSDMQMIPLRWQKVRS